MKSFDEKHKMDPPSYPPSYSDAVIDFTNENKPITLSWENIKVVANPKIGLVEKLGKTLCNKFANKSPPPPPKVIINDGNFEFHFLKAF